MAMRQALDLWKASPDEGRARRSPAIARAANRFVATHPAAPLSREIESSLPAYLKRQATSALDHAQPVHAHLYFRAARSGAREPLRALRDDAPPAARRDGGRRTLAARRYLFPSTL
jgi:hypothetical protein